MFIATLLTINNWWVNGQRCDISAMTKKKFFPLQQYGWGYFAKWSKPNRERQIMHGTLICGNENKSQTHRNNRKMVVNRK